MIEKGKFWLPLAAALALASAALAATVTVMVQETQIRRRPQFYAPAVATVHLGQRLESEDAQNGWYPVSSEKGDGFIHSSAVTSKSVSLSSAKSIGAGSTSAEEITLAGKGFNEQVERSYKGKNSDVDFGAVDAMEKRKVSDVEVLKFMQAGQLLPEGRP